MNPRPLVSILIPCYNAERYIGEAIESALAQTYDPIEVIVQDDGSTDGSLDVIRRFADGDNVRWETGPNRGGNAARNRLLKLARGEFVQFLDADDLLMSDKIEMQLEAFDFGPDAVFCNYLAFGDRQQVKDPIAVYPEVDSDLITYFISHAVITMLPLHRRKHLLEVGGFDESLPCCQEYELHVRLAMNTWRRVARVPRPLACRREVADSVSSNEARVFSVNAKLLKRWHAELLSDDCLTEARIDALAEGLYRCGRHLARHGLHAEAEEAFEYATQIAPNARMPAKWPLRLLTRLFGPVRAERMRLFIRPSRPG